MPLIEISSLSKEFKLRKRYNQVWKTLLSFIRPRYNNFTALNSISLTINKGELVGYIGPNGAGKSTTIKILSGILTPSSGKVLVKGREPYKHRRKNALSMGVVFGQRSQLYWDLPLIDSLDMFRVMYKIPKEEYNERLDFLKDILGLHDFMNRPVRQLSLGQKMRANLCSAFIHNPDIVYLDEPTIGLDVMAKEAIRKFIRHINEKYGTTVILTTHDMDDIEEICERLILLNRGKIIFDGPLDQFKIENNLGSEIIMELSSPINSLNPGDNKQAILIGDNTIKVKVQNKDSVPSTVQDYLSRYPVKDISVQSSSLEEIIKNVFKD